MVLKLLFSVLGFVIYYNWELTNEHYNSKIIYMEEK